MKVKTVLAFLAALPVFALASECTCGKTNPTEEFVKEARKVYPTPLYSSYTNSIIRKYKCKKGMHDKNEGTRVGWVDVDGARNVRDLGGWNGLASGKVYRGSELNAVKNHGLALTPEGLRTMREKMKIKTDLDFRAVNEGERAECLKTSALGKDVKLVDRPISNYTSMFSKTNSFASALRVFADSGNYPIYMHCWGGADRTGTIAFILQGLCGVGETDLAIDFELTSFACFGTRTRHNAGSFKYADMILELKSYKGATLADKFRTYAKETLGLADWEIDAIRKNLMNQ